MGVIYLHGIAYGKGSGGSGGTTDYNELANKPQINNVTLVGNKSAVDDLGIKEDPLTTEQLEALLSLI